MFLTWKRKNERRGESDEVRLGVFFLKEKERRGEVR